MNVFIDYKLNDSGKGKFIQRLIPALRKIGVKCKFKQKGCDVALGVSGWKTKTSLPRVLRVDGIYLDKGKKQTWRNKQIRTAISKSDYVIYQSKFSKNTVNKKFKINPPCSVIYNGANPDDYRNAKPIKSPYKYNVLMAARWGNRKHKRLDAHLEAIKNTNSDNVHFWLAGECDVKSTEKLTVLGYLPDEELRRYMVMADTFLYLADLDWCPNVIVEARIARMDIEHNKSCKAVDELIYADLRHLHIDYVARQYKKVFKHVRR